MPKQSTRSPQVHAAVTSSSHVPTSVPRSGVSNLAVEGNPMINRCKRAGLALAFVSCWAAPAWAQTDEGRIAGLVSDATGAVVPGVTVTVRNDRTGDERTTTTSTQGRFVLAGLKPSVYTVRANLSGFSAQEFSSQKGSAGQELVVDFSLSPAAQAEQITVSGELSAIDTSSARMGANVNEREVTFLPINGRQLSQLYLQAPGALNSGTGTFGDIRFSGRAVQQNVIRYDGIEGSAVIDASPGNLNGEIPSPFRLQSSLENVQEFRVDSNSYPAEYGTGSGGQITVVTKSGTNAFHGAAFEYFRDDSFDSPNEFDPVVNGEKRKSALRQHQFGASLGGPIVKDKAFFFASYEGYRLDSGLNFVEAIPSEAAWARAVPAVLPLRPGFKAPEAIILPGASANPDFDIAQLQGVANVDEDAFSARLDVKLSPSQRLYARYFRDDGFNEQPEGVTGRRAQVSAKPQNAVLALQSSFGNGLLNELKIGYNRADTNVVGVAPTIPNADLSAIVIRSEERRVGNECRSRRSTKQ